MTGIPTGVCAPVPFFFPPFGTILLMRMAFSRGFDLRGMFIGWPLCISWITGYWEENSYTLSIPFSCRCIAEPDYILYILYSILFIAHIYQTILIICNRFISTGINDFDLIWMSNVMNEWGMELMNEWVMEWMKE